MAGRAAVPPTYLLVAIVVMAALHFLVPLRTIIPLPYNCLGVLPLLVGLAVNIWASHLFNKVNTTVKPFEESSYLVTEGPYRVSRHPMYLGMALVLAGMAVILGTVAPFIVVPVFVVLVDRKFIAVEEKAMEQRFADAYGEYKKRVRRWV